MISGPAWDQDDRPGVKTMAKICPDCEVFDAQRSDPRKGMRHASEFGLHYKSKDGLQPYCRHHMGQRRRHERTTAAPNSTGRLSAAGMRALQPADPATEEAPSNGHLTTDTAASPPSVLVGDVARLETTQEALRKDLSALAERLGRLESGTELRAVEQALDERITALEDVETTPTPSGSGELVIRLQAALEALAGRIAALERAEKGEEGTASATGHEEVNTRSLRRWTKQLGKEVGNLATRVDRADGKAAEAVRMAQAAARVNAGRPSDAPPMPNLQTLKAEILATLRSELRTEQEAAAPAPQEPSPLSLAQIQDVVDARLKERLATPNTEKETIMTQMTQLASPPWPQATTGDDEQSTMRRTVLDVLARYTAGLRNVAQIEHDGLLDPSDISLIAERIQQRSADELCRYIGDLCAQARSED